MTTNKQDSTTRAAEAPSEHLAALLRLESVHYMPLLDRQNARNDPGNPSFSRRRERDEWRCKICDWFYHTADHFGYNREVVLFALSFLDRSITATYKARTETYTSREYKLLAVTALYLAIKLHGQAEKHSYRRALHVHEMAQLAREPIPAKSIEWAEGFILDALQWHVNTPTSLSLASWMTRVFRASNAHLPAKLRDSLYQNMRYLCELAAYDFDLGMYFPASTIAYASIICAMDATAFRTGTALPHSIRQGFIGSLVDLVPLTPTTPAVVECVCKIKHLVPQWFVTVTPRAILETPTPPSMDQSYDKTPPTKRVRHVVSPVGVVGSFDDARFCDASDPAAHCLY